MEQTEAKLKLESEIVSLKREHKYALENVSRVKLDTNELISTKERLNKEISDANYTLTKVLNDISDSKLAWAIEKQKEAEKITNKNIEVQKILDKESELNKKEEEVKETEKKITGLRNENRQLELKLEKDNIALDVKRREIEDKNKDLEQEKKDFELKKDKFKKELSELVKIYG